jgi:hypothetical protein
VSDPATDSPALPVRRPGRRPALAVAAVMLVLTCLCAPAFNARGYELDEGTLLVYPELLRDGKLPYRDYSTLYGPGNTVNLAAVYAVTGPSLDAERAVGVFYRAVTVVAIMALASMAGLAAAVCAGLLAVALFVAPPLFAQAIVGAVGLALLAVALALRAVSGSFTPRRAELALALAGAAGGWAVFMRFDLAPGVLLSLAPIVALAGRRGRLAALGGFAAFGVAPWVVMTALAGPSRIFDLISDAHTGQKARQLPRPALVTGEGAILYLAVLLIVAMVAAGFLVARRDRADPRPRAVLGTGLLGLGLLPYAFGRADYTHVIASALPVLALGAPYAAALGRRSIRVGAAFAAVVALVTVGAPLATASALHDRLDFLLSSDRYTPARVSVGNRSFLLDDGTAAAEIQPAARALHAMAQKGDSVFVGPRDLRVAALSDSYVYHLLMPKLRPATRFLEINPDLTNASDSPLASELEHVDWLFLNGRPTVGLGPEPNDSFRPGNPAPNRVVRDHFCAAGRFGLVFLYHRCR